MKGRYSDEIIYQGIKNNSPEITGYIYEMYWIEVQNIISGKGGTKSEAKDAFQSVMLKLYLKIKNGEINISDFKSYFIRSCVNEFFYNRRNHNKKIELKESDNEIIEETDEVEEFKSIEIALKSFNLLREECKRILILRSQNLSYIEISKLLKLKGESSAKKRRERCLKYFFGIYSKMKKNDSE
ncbi:MAG: hypothetical protein A2W91_05950 [Bacteroidetes bacterium GWF2_38_335]|nr:MAG: hypothetical protein A2W91_05950 [Bacteroidetes bacterium GWF2_38_335]OFY81617.1 MAG: hypothetical protein A2281_11745 [Bacteroidetes bacterium RIFOXYA12_FULL_38_20]HBS88969.1 hypothetical protein [Bacteroidales bacterium]